MASLPPESVSLEQLQSPEQIELLDAIDKLRNKGLGHYDISLPQLITCGDQSSGKSSLLEGLTRLRFPTKDGLCTTFATELVLRRHDKIEISCTIVPGKARSQAERRELAKFRRQFASREEFSFPSLVHEAKERMSIGTRSNRGPFFEDVLCVKYSGPDLPSLTIVDLPGIIHSSPEGEDSTERVLELIRGYMRDEKSIILAVVSGKSDLRSQAIFKLFKEFDPTACRTLGIVTKPDYLKPGTSSEADFVKLLKNERTPLKLGWHAVKNRDTGEEDQSDAERDEAERIFFSNGVWATLPRHDVGIASLRTRLSRVLLDHIGKELPSLVSVIQAAVVSTEISLKALGNSRDSYRQQHDFLTEKAEKFQLLTSDALRGIYTNPFFNLDSTREQTPTRLRTEIQNLNLAFAHTIYHKGHTWDIVDQNQPITAAAATPIALSSQAIQEYDAQFDEPAKITRSLFLQEHIGDYVRHSRQSGLPSIVNPWVIGEVFRRQSEPWKVIAEHHLHRVFQAVKEYIDLGLSSLMDTRTRNMLMLEQIEPELEHRWEDAKAKLNELLLPYTDQDPVTYDPSFIIEIGEIRSRRSQNPLLKKLSAQQLLTESLDDFTNSEILDLMQTYYKKAISVFINNVAVLAIENCLIARLESIFSPMLISRMEEEQLRIIASESEDIRSQRTMLKQKLEDLKYGKRVLHVHAGSAARSVVKPVDRAARPSPRSPRPSTTKAHPQTPPIQAESPARTPPNDIALDTITTSFTNLTVTPPPSDPKPARPVYRSRSRSTTPTPAKKGAGKRKVMKWPPTYSTTDQSESEDAMYSPVQSVHALREMAAQA